MTKRPGIFNCPLLLGLGLLVLVAGGCVDDHVEGEVIGQTEPAAAAPPASSSPASHVVPDVVSPDPKPLPGAAQDVEAQTAFQYPFPDREDLFSPPNKKPPAREARPEHSQDVVLMGFANLGGVRVVLRIDGIVTSLRVGESRGEVRVLAIDPPNVNLQQGDRQWAESLFDTQQADNGWPGVSADNKPMTATTTTSDQ